jgi:Nuclear transport factor 2 (NTF2) domain.
MTDPHGDQARDGTQLARDYYRAIDAGDMEALRAVLAPAFTQERGDRTITGRDEFVQFMAGERPETDTEHHIDMIYTAPDGVAVQGRLFHGDGSLFFGFVDVFQVEGQLSHLITYSNG